jgi:transposase
MDMERRDALVGGVLRGARWVPAVVLSDRISCLRGPIVADRVVAHPNYVRFATHYGFRPDWCEAADPESKGLVLHCTSGVGGS